jgi:hypothetical protein
VPTFATQPPGKRRNDGCRAAIFSARSLRIPWSFHVSWGSTETMSKSTCVSGSGVPPTITATRPALVVPVAFSTPWYLVQVPERTVVFAVA